MKRAVTASLVTTAASIAIVMPHYVNRFTILSNLV